MRLPGTEPFGWRWGAALAAGLLVAACTVLAGCAGGPDIKSSRDKLVAAEATYQAAVQSAIQLAEAGVIKGSVAEDVKGYIVGARMALDVWHLSVDDKTAQERALSAVVGLQAILQAYLDNHGPPQYGLPEKEKPS